MFVDVCAYVKLPSRPGAYELSMGSFVPLLLYYAFKQETMPKSNSSSSSKNNNVNCTLAGFEGQFGMDSCPVGLNERHA